MLSRCPLSCVDLPSMHSLCAEQWWEQELQRERHARDMALQAPTSIAIFDLIPANWTRLASCEEVRC